MSVLHVFWLLRGCAVSTTTAYELNERGVGVPSPGRVKKVSVIQIIHTGSGVHPTSYPMGDSFPGGKAAGT
jgi:hypothetical protein